MILNSETTPVSYLPELDWLNKHTGALKAYAGQWLAVLPDGIAVSNENLKRLTEIVKEKKIKDPLYYYVDPGLPDEDGFTRTGEEILD